MSITPLYPDLTESNKLHKQQVDRMLKTVKRTSGPTAHTLDQQRQADNLERLRKQGEASRQSDNKKG